MKREKPERKPPGTRNSKPGSARERKAAETRERISQAALELMAEHGPSGVTVEQIAVRAEIGKGTFFNYFASKEAVIACLGGTQAERLEAALTTGEVRGTPRERLLQSLDVLASHPLLTPELARGLFISCLSEHSQRDLEAPNIWYIRDLLAVVIREGQAQGQFRTDVAPEEAALVALGQFFLAMLAWCAGFVEGPLSGAVQRYAELTLDGLSASQTPAGLGGMGN